MFLKPTFLAGAFCLVLQAPAWAGALDYGNNPHLDELFATLQTPGGDKYEATEREVIHIFRHSGSAAMDLLLARGLKALEAGNPSDAVWHFSALIDHAPDFAAAYNARATAWYELGEIGLALDDLQIALTLNPRNFIALTGFGIISEEQGKDALALEAYNAAFALDPHYEGLSDAIERVETRISIAH